MKHAIYGRSGIELVQQLCESRLARQTGRPPGWKIDRRLLQRAASSGAVDFPPPRVGKTRAMLHHHRVVVTIEICAHGETVHATADGAEVFREFLLEKPVPSTRSRRAWAAPPPPQPRRNGHLSASRDQPLRCHPAERPPDQVRGRLVFNFEQTRICKQPQDAWGASPGECHGHGSSYR